MEGRLIPGLLLLFLPALAKADTVNAEWYSTTRALSMGNVGIASAEDPVTAAFYNPAALANNKRPGFEPFNLQLEGGFGNFSVAQSLGDWAKVGSFSRAKPLLAAKPGRPFSGSVALFPSVSAQNFSFGLLGQFQFSSYYDKTKNAYFYHARKLLAPSLGLSAALLGGRLRLGVAVRALQVSETDMDQPGTGSIVAVRDSHRSGLGVGMDAGMMLTMPWAGLPTIGFVARNIGDTAFPAAPVVDIGGSASARRESVKMAYDGGISLSPKLGRGQRLVLAADYRDALDSTHVALLRRLNLGLEFSGKVLALRAGFSRGTWTAGFGLQSRQGSLDIGTYAEELDARALRAVLDRRFSLRFTRRF